MIKKRKFVEWFGYSASVSPYILEQFEKWAGYKWRAEYIVDQGYHNSLFRVPSKQFKDFIEFQQIEVCKLAKELVDIVHGYGKEAMMFWVIIGLEQNRMVNILKQLVWML